METLTFLITPLLACLLLILIHAYFGIHILERGIIFVDLALAQFIGIGIALSLLWEGEGSSLLSLLFAFVGAAVLALSKKASRYVNIEAFIGVLYIFSLVTSILILDRTPYGLEEFKAILNGNILWTPELLVTMAVYGAVGLPLLRGVAFRAQLRARGLRPEFIVLRRGAGEIGSDGRHLAGLLVPCRASVDRSTLLPGTVEGVAHGMAGRGTGEHARDHRLLPL
jgi:ABC-type Mn2+/Zn2+ transport system permease subunit